MSWQHIVIVVWAVGEMISAVLYTNTELVRTPKVQAYNVSTWIIIIGLLVWGQA